MSFEEIISKLMIPFLSALIAWGIALKTAKNEIRKAQGTFVEMLYAKRLELYPELWSIVDKIYGDRKKHKTEVEIVTRNRDECLHDMRGWKRKHGIYFSEISLEAFYNLEKALALDTKYSSYDKQKKERIEKAKSSFFGALKRDVGIMGNAEESIRKALNPSENSWLQCVVAYFKKK